MQDNSSMPSNIAKRIFSLHTFGVQVLYIVYHMLYAIKYYIPYRMLHTFEVQGSSGDVCWSAVPSSWARTTTEAGSNVRALI